MVMELAHRGTLSTLLFDSKTPTPPWSIRLQIALDVAHALQYLHNHDPVIVYRDLKPENILLRKDWSAFLADFGIAKEGKLTTGTPAFGSILWMAPEMWDKQKKSTPAIDIYTFGLVCYALLTRQIPFSNVDALELYGVKSMGQTPKIPREEDNAAMKDCPVNYVPLMQDCWKDEKPPLSVIISQLSEMLEAKKNY